MFNEKAEELHTTKEELTSSKRKISDLEYREEELLALLNKTRASMDDQFKEKSKEVEQEMAKLQKNSNEVQMELDTVKDQYKDLQESYRHSVDLLGRRLYDISDLLKEYQEMEQKLKAKNSNSSLEHVSSINHHSSQEDKQNNNNNNHMHKQSLNSDYVKGAEENENLTTKSKKRKARKKRSKKLQA